MGLTGVRVRRSANISPPTRRRTYDARKQKAGQHVFQRVLSDTLMRRGTLPVLGALLTGAFLSSCDSARSPAPDAARAGVVPAWTLSSQPRFRVSSGELGGGTIYFFPAGRGTFVPGGGVVFAFGPAFARVVELDEAGNVVALLGGPGSGPGEFDSVSRIFLVGPDVVVWDRRNARMSVFRNGTLIDTRPIRLPGHEMVVGVFPDATAVTTVVPDPVVPVFRLPEGAPRSYRLWNSEGREVGILTGGPELPSASLSLAVESRGPGVFNRMMVGGTCLPEWKHMVMGDALILADAANGTLLSLDHASGGIRELYRATYWVPATAAMIEQVERWIETTAERVGGVSPASRKTALARIGAVGDPLPSFWGQMLSNDADGTIWLRRASSCFGSEQDHVWEVVDLTGRLIATVTTPSNLEVHAVSGDRVLGVQTDAMRLEYVTVFAVKR